jgi:hypothetical protein
MEALTIFLDSRYKNNKKYVGHYLAAEMTDVVLAKLFLELIQKYPVCTNQTG